MNSHTFSSEKESPAFQQRSMPLSRKSTSKSDTRAGNKIISQLIANSPRTALQDQQSGSLSPRVSQLKSTQEMIGKSRVVQRAALSQSSLLGNCALKDANSHSNQGNTEPVLRKAWKQVIPAPTKEIPSLSNYSPTQVIQCLGTNVDMVEEDDRHFETLRGESRLRVNPDADAYLEDQFEKGSESKLADHTTLGDRFTHSMEHVHKGIPYNREEKVSAFAEHRQPIGDHETRKERGLGVMLHGKAATCWEKAAFYHLVLAELGIPTKLEAGYRKTDNEGHAWLVVKPNKDFFGGKSVVIDPTSGKVSSRSSYEKSFNITIPAKAAASPKVAQSPKEIEKALREFHSISELGGIFKKAVLETVDLKIERKKHEIKNKEEMEEFDRLLSNLFKS